MSYPPKPADAYELWQQLPDNVRECISAPGSNSYSRRVMPGDEQARLITVISFMGAEEVRAAENTWVLNTSDGVTVFSSMEKILRGDRAGHHSVGWVYLPGLLKLLGEP